MCSNFIISSWVISRLLPWSWNSFSTNYKESGKFSIQESYLLKLWSQKLVNHLPICMPGESPWRSQDPYPWSWSFLPRTQYRFHREHCQCRGYWEHWENSEGHRDDYLRLHRGALLPACSLRTGPGLGPYLREVRTKIEWQIPCFFAIGMRLVVRKVLPGD